jgi:hypothetical protein
MHNNKVLGVAITAALSMGMNTAVQAAAGDFDLTVPAAGVNYAYELFPDSTTAINTTAPNKVVYEASKAFSDEFYAKFTLSSGGWDAALDSGALVASGGGTKVALVDKGDKGDSEAKFLITGGVALTDTLTFDFKFTDTDNVLANEGGQIKLSAYFGIAANETLIAQTTPDDLLVANAVQGVGWDIEPDTTAGEIAIDVTNNSQTFVGGVTDTMVNLGSFALFDRAALDLAATTFNFDVDLPTATATLTVTNGIFNASKDATGTLNKEMVFIDWDCNSTGTFDETAGDIAATTLTDTTATWDIDSDPLHSGTNPLWTTGNTRDNCIKVIADGTTPIKPQANAPDVLLSLNFGNQTKDFPGKLRHVKRNGTTCWIYNVPNINALDLGFIRVTNSSSLNGVLKGELRNEAGDILFTEVDLLEGSTLAPNATAVIPNTKLAEFAKAVDPANEVWDRRAVLIISSNLPEGTMEAFGLLRKSGTPGGPLMNISTGAGGNSCNN